MAKAETTIPGAFLSVLARLADAFSAYEETTGRPAILVGGAAVAIHTDGAFMSADFDILALDDDGFFRAMDHAGFLRDPAAGHGLGGWYHPDHPEYAVEQVSGSFFDGRGDRHRCLRLQISDKSIVLASAEDMIADRLGQHAVSQGDDIMLEQARLLYSISKDLDEDYLLKRIVDEGGKPDLLGL